MNVLAVFEALYNEQILFLMRYASSSYTLSTDSISISVCLVEVPCSVA